MGERRLVVQLTPLGRRAGLLAATLAPLAWLLATLESAGGIDLRASGGAVLFLCLALSAALAHARVRAGAGLARLALRADEPVCADEGEALLLPVVLELPAGGGELRDLELLAGHARAGVARTLGFVPALAAGGAARAGCSWRLARRGRWRELKLSLSSAWPLGLVEARLELCVPADVLALPRRFAPGVLPAPAASGHGNRETRQRRLRGAAELCDLRRWREGEDTRLVHWKVSARTGELVLRELEGEERGVLRLFLVARRAGGAREGFEQAVRAVATLARDALARHGEVRTAVIGASRVEGPSVRRADELFALFAFLAEVESCEESAADLRALAREARARGEQPLFVHAGCGMALPEAQLARALDAQALEEPLA